MIQQAIQSLHWDKAPQGLYEPIAYTLSGEGKRVRPTLLLTAAKIFGGNEQMVMPAALAIEVFHNFTLLHDDVMDKALVRRGRPTVHVKWNENTAILSGDQMMIESYKLLAQLPDNYLPTVLRMFNKMGTEICEGQQYDVDFESQQDVTISEYLKMIEYKTSVLLATALQIGGYLAGATQAQQDALYAFGIHVGLAFQVQDDYLDVYGDPVSFGKSIGGDICCNKKTFMLLNAMDRADASIREQLYQLLQLPVDTPQQRAHKIMQVTAIYDSLDVKQVAQAFILEQTDKACECLNQLPQNQHTHSLRELAHRLVNRNQ